MIVKCMLILTFAIIITFGYGSGMHARRNQVFAYHRFWPGGDMTPENNPNHHPNHCWSYFEHEAEYYFPNPNNMSYPPRNRIDGDMSPFSTSTSFVYIFVGACLLALVIEEEPVKDNIYIPAGIDTGGVVLSLAWVAASSAEFHREPNEITRHSDYASIAPLLAWVGAASAGFQQWNRRVGILYEMSCVFTTLYMSIALPKEAILVGLSILIFGYIVLLVRKHRDRFDALNVIAIVVSAYAAVACKSFGNTPYSLDAFSGLVPNHNYHHLAECTNDVTAARLEDISHGWWHVLSALSLWFIIMSAFGFRPLDDKFYLYIAYYTAVAGVIALLWTAHELRPSTYIVWQGVTYGVLFTWALALSLSINKTNYKRVEFIEG